MTHKKGETNNPNGRPKGTPNKITADLRKRISDFLNDNWQQVEKDFKVLEPEKRVLIYERLLNFALPKLQTIQTPDLKKEDLEPSIILQYEGKPMTLKT